MLKKTTIISLLVILVFGAFMVQRAHAARGTLPDPFRPPVKSPVLPV